MRKLRHRGLCLRPHSWDFKAGHWGWAGYQETTLTRVSVAPALSPERQAGAGHQVKVSRAGWASREGAGSEVRGAWEGPGGSVSHQEVPVTGLEMAAGGGCSLLRKNQ